jgi:hypothetical protein
MNRSPVRNIIKHTTLNDCETLVAHCHYCGFGCEDQHPPPRCPKCGGSTWERWERGAELPPLSQRNLTRTATHLQRRQLVVFRLWQPAERVFLVLRGAGSGEGVIHLQQVREHLWQKLVYLTPGVYRYRFYIDDGRSLTWLAPEEHEALQSGAFDSVLHVGRQCSSEPGPLQVRRIGIGPAPTETPCA